METTLYQIPISSSRKKEMLKTIDWDDFYAIGKTRTEGRFLQWDIRNKLNFNADIIRKLDNLFPYFDDLYADGEICYSQLEFLNKFKGKKVLLLAGGPSTNDVKWENLDYDYIVTLNHFFKNERLKNKKVDLAVIGGEVDLQSEDFLSYVSEHNPYLFFEVHSRWYNEIDYLKKLYEEYTLMGCFHTRFYGKLGGGNRLLLFMLYLRPEILYFAGLDGPKPMIEQNHAFEGKKNTLPHGVDRNNAANIFEDEYEVFWMYINILSHLNYFDTSLYNLGEGFDYNMSSKYSKKSFPLTEEIKDLIRR